MYKLQLHIKKGEIVLTFKNGRKVADILAWEDGANLSEKLLVEIDRMLQKNGVRKEDVAKMTVKSDIPAGYSTVRIARTVAKVWNW